MKLFAILALAAMSANAQKAHPMISSSTALGDQVITHIADGGGWFTGITLINLGNSPASFTIGFYNDSGAPMELQLKTGQIIPGAGASGQQIPVGGSWNIRTADQSSQTTTGWAFISHVVGNIGGYAIFVYGNGQMATVPIESGSVSRFMLQFTNEPGWSMGVALVNACIDYGTLTVTFRDFNGSALLVDSIPMSPGQHMSFVLGRRYPQLVGLDGTALFESNGCPIAGLGILANSAGAYTTVFALDAP